VLFFSLVERYGDGIVAYVSNSFSVNMYASCYLLTKVDNVESMAPRSREGSIELEGLEI
jgi:hypothetical protein